MPLLGRCHIPSYRRKRKRRQGGDTASLFFSSFADCSPRFDGFPFRAADRHRHDGFTLAAVEQKSLERRRVHLLSWVEISAVPAMPEKRFLGAFPLRERCCFHFQFDVGA